MHFQPQPQSGAALEAETNPAVAQIDLGEFELESVPSESLRLSVGVPEIGTLTLPGLLIGRSERAGAGSLGPQGGSGRRTKARHA